MVVEYEAEAVDLVLVDGVVIEHSYVHLPFSEVVCFDEVDARRKLLFGLDDVSVMNPLRSMYARRRVVQAEQSIVDRLG